MTDRRTRRIFFGSFFGTLCVLALLFGVYEVDTNSRRIGFGDNKTLIYQLTGKTWQESCNDAKIWYNNLVLSLTESAVEESNHEAT
jgi:hypothetical protein